MLKANNMGKTSILEVIRSLKSPNSIVEWDRTARRGTIGYVSISISPAQHTRS